MVTRAAAGPDAGLFAGPGDARAHARAVDWAATSLGPVDGWHPSLRTAVRLCLDARSAMAVWAGPDRILLHNDAYAAVLGTRADGAFGQPLRTVWAEVWEAIAPEFRRVIDEGESIRHDEMRFVLHRDGRDQEACFTYGLTPIRGDDGRILGAFNVVEEITAAVRARDAHEDRHRALLDSVDEGFCIVEVAFDAHGVGVDYRFLETNPAFERHTGLRDPVGRTARELVPGLEPHWPATYGRIATTGHAERFTEHSAAMGRWFEVDAFRIGGPEARTVGLLFRDITERRRAEEALRESRARLEAADRQKNHFLAVLSHELRNPLGAARNGLQVLGRVPAGSDAARRALDVIDRQVGQLAYLVDDLLDITRITLGKVQLKRERVDLGEVVARALADLADGFERGGVETRMHGPPGPVVVDGDAHRLSQVVGNLLHNAAKFTPRGGQVWVSVATDEAAREARVTVRDTGSGIAPALVPRLFEPFVQADDTLDRRQGGLGLGLALVKRLVALQGGTVEGCSDGPGTGATFVVRLPLAAGSPAPSPVVAGPPAPGHRRVLVIDDNADGADSLQLLLELEGHTVAVARDGPAGLARAGDFRPDVVLCDIGLPGMDGYAVARALRASDDLAHVRLVALTGYARPEDLAHAAEAGFDLHLAKPPDLDRLQAALRTDG